MRVLLADDDEGILVALELLFRRGHIDTARARSPAQVLAQMATGAFDAVLLDLNYERDTTSGEEGFELLRRLRQDYPRVPVAVMTGWASIEGAVEAMRRGAIDYVPKPWDNARLVALFSERAPEHGPEGGAPSGATLAEEHAAPAMQELHATIEQVAFSDVAVLITGEHGSGKELVARSLHERSGRRGPFVALNAGALAEGTFESELFGHVRGAFTDAKSARQGAFARAEGGTLFLDEIANMPGSQQAKLLRVLQERSYQPLGAAELCTSSARIVSATNIDIDALVREGQFRADLLYRLNTIHLRVPPLRERREELPRLFSMFLEREVARYGLTRPRVAPEVLPALERHAWPGNVRELLHVVQRAVLLSARQGVLEVAHLDLRRGEPAAGAGLTGAPLPAASERPQTVKDAERLAIERALSQYPSDRRAAAESLGLSRSAFYRRLSQYGIRPHK
jgi:DNA-binding NtrC family response regulator